MKYERERERSDTVRVTEKRGAEKTELNFTILFCAL